MVIDLIMMLLIRPDFLDWLTFGPLGVFWMLSFNRCYVTIFFRADCLTSITFVFGETFIQPVWRSNNYTITWFWGIFLSQAKHIEIGCSKRWNFRNDIRNLGKYSLHFCFSYSQKVEDFILNQFLVGFYVFFVIFIFNQFLGRFVFLVVLMVIVRSNKSTVHYSKIHINTYFMNTNLYFKNTNFYLRI